MDVTLLLHISWLVQIFLLSGDFKIRQLESVHRLALNPGMVWNDTRKNFKTNKLKYNTITKHAEVLGSSKTHYNINSKLIFCDWYTWEKVRNTGNEYGYGIRKKIAELSTGTGTDTDYFQKMKYGKSTGTDSFWNPRSEVGTDSELFLETRYGYGYGYY